MATQNQWFPIKGRIPYDVAKSLREQGVLRLGVDNSLAANIIHNTKWNPAEKSAQILWSWVAILIFLGSIYFSFTWHWWSFIIGFFLMRMVWKATKKSSSEFVLERALMDQMLYERVLDVGGWQYLATVPQDVFERQYLKPIGD